jgi:hypothetical protein
LRTWRRAGTSSCTPAPTKRAQRSLRAGFISVVVGVVGRR